MIGEEDQRQSLDTTNTQVTGHGKEGCEEEVRVVSQKLRERASLVVQCLGICLQCRGHGFEPWSGRIPHAAEQRSLCATTTEPTSYNF